jgi:hypothetical protein
MARPQRRIAFPPEKLTVLNIDMPSSSVVSVRPRFPVQGLGNFDEYAGVNGRSQASHGFSTFSSPSTLSILAANNPRSQPATSLLPAKPHSESRFTHPDADGSKGLRTYRSSCALKGPCGRTRSVHEE